MKKFLLIACVLALTGRASAAGSWNFGGFAAESQIFGTDTTPVNYALYAILEEDTSAAELSKYFAGVTFNEFKTKADENAMNNSASVVNTTVSVDGVFSDGNARTTYLDDYGVSHGLYAVIVHDNAQFKVMESTVMIPPKGYLVYSGGDWASFLIPEPTSAWLLLLGVAGLSLRRRKSV